MEKCRTNMQVQFDQWYNNLHGRTGIMLLNAVSQQGQSEHIEPAAAKQTKADNSERGRNDRLTESKLEYGGNSLDSKVPQNQKDQGGDVNEDILAFYQAKEELLKRRAGH